MAIEILDTQNQTEATKLDLYRQLVMQFLTESSHEPGKSEIDNQRIFDMQHDHYLILGQGWRGQERVYGVWIHLDIQDGKVWIQRNQTEIDIEAELIARGIAKSDLVRGLIPPQYRALLGSNEL